MQFVKVTNGIRHNIGDEYLGTVHTPVLVRTPDTDRAMRAFAGLASRSKSIFDTLYLYFRRPVLGCIDADLCK